MANKAPFTLRCIATLACVGGVVCLAQGQVSPQLGRSIMGKNFLGVEEVGQHLGVRLSPEDLARVRDVSFSEATLRQNSDSHILFLGIARDSEGKPLTITRLRQMFPREGQPRFRSYLKPSEPRQLYSDRATPQLRWYLISRSLRDESRSKPYWQQEQSLRKNEYRERAVVYVYMMILVFKARGQRLYEEDLVWCNDTGPDGATVAAGYFGPEGIYVSDWWLRADEHFGLAPARKPDSP